MRDRSTSEPARQVMQNILAACFAAAYPAGDCYNKHARPITAWLYRLQIKVASCWPKTVQQFRPAPGMAQKYRHATTMLAYDQADAEY